MPYSCFNLLLIIVTRSASCTVYLPHQNTLPCWKKLVSEGEHRKTQEAHKVQHAVPALQELRDTLLMRALEEASVVMITDYCKIERV